MIAGKSINRVIDLSITGYIIHNIINLINVNYIYIYTTARWIHVLLLCILNIFCMSFNLYYKENAIYLSKLSYRIVRNQTLASSGIYYWFWLYEMLESNVSNWISCDLRHILKLTLHLCLCYRGDLLATQTFSNTDHFSSR